jgi:hypothetical protein
MASMTSKQSNLVDLVKDVIDVEGRVDRHPYGMMAGALGAGFVLGGGLFTRLTGRIIGAVVRVGVMAALPRLEKELEMRIRRAAEAANLPNEKGD